MTYVPCPNCKSTQVFRERRPDGDTGCQACGLRLKHSDWDKRLAVVNVVKTAWSYEAQNELTVQSVASEIAALDRDDPKFLRNIQAKIKRLVHAEKFSLLHRISLAGKDSPEFGMQVVKEKCETHKTWMQKSDDEIITW